jgi:hypothetical protein
MKKFILMIISVSVFFIGVGGIVNQVKARFRPDFNSRAVIIKTPLTIETEEQINSGKSLTIVEKANTPMIIKRGGGAGNDPRHTQFRLSAPEPPERIIIFPGEKSRGARLSRGEDLSGIEDKKVIHFRRFEGKELNVTEPLKDAENALAGESKTQIIREICER